MGTMLVTDGGDGSASRHRRWVSRRARPTAVARWEKVLPDELSAAGLMVPVPSVTPKPLMACAEYMATAGVARRRPRHGRWLAAEPYVWTVVANAFCATAAPRGWRWRWVVVEVMAGGCLVPQKPHMLGASISDGRMEAAAANN